jgi:TM2 domain-containing membrane protein YozV
MSQENEQDPNQTTGGWTSVPTPDATAKPAGFCQDCGRPLTPETLRTVGTGVFCDPCLHARVAATPPAGTYVPPVPGTPNPVLAAVLGFIPGVGAFYNGQFTKGFLHLIVFAVLVSMSDHVSGVFGLFVFAWIIYQVFDAYHTARARRDGDAVPDPIGFNDLSEHINVAFKANVNARAAQTGTPTAPPVTPPPPPTTGPVPGSGWVGYVPPTAFAQSPPYAAPYTQAPPPPAPPWQPVPYADTFAGTPAPGAPLAPLAPLPAQSRLPIGAFWLIGLGVVILLANFVPDLRINGRWFVPVILAAVAVYIFTRRLGAGVRIICHLRWPVILMTLAVLFALQSLDIATLGQTWPVLVIAIGLLLLLERTLGTAAPYIPAAPVSTSVVPGPESPRATFTPDTDDTTKGGL